MAIPQKVKYIRNSIPGYTLERIQSRDSNRYVQTDVHSRIITLAKWWKQPHYPSTMAKSIFIYIHTMEYYEILLHGRI